MDHTLMRNHMTAVARLFEAGLGPRPVVDSPAFKAWFRNSKVLDADGRPLAVYHGTGRPDRVGNRFRKSRATAGPMAYFTDDPEIASGYATGKADTSLNDEDNHYATWFKVKVPGSRAEVSLDRAWHFLPHEEQRRILALAPRVTRDDDETLLGGPEVTNGIGNYEQAFREARRNPLMALVDGWLQGGVLFNEEAEFLTVLRLAGMTTPVRFEHPHATYPAVYAVYMSIQKPLVSSTVPKEVLDSLQKAAGRSRTRGNDNGYQWDKRNVDARTWFRLLLDDIERSGGTNSWTVIPDWVTDVLKAFGYDGIQDTGGKQGGAGHDVWIPFEEHQVKSAISNTAFRADKNSIHEAGRGA